jgi:hypothetical protein
VKPAKGKAAKSVFAVFAGRAREKGGDASVPRITATLAFRFEPLFPIKADQESSAADV